MAPLSRSSCYGFWLADDVSTFIWLIMRVLAHIQDVSRVVVWPWLMMKLALTFRFRCLWSGIGNLKSFFAVVSDRFYETAGRACRTIYFPIHKNRKTKNMHDKQFNGLAPKICIIRLASGSPDNTYFIGACPLNYNIIGWSFTLEDVERSVWNKIVSTILSCTLEKPLPLHKLCWLCEKTFFNIFILHSRTSHFPDL